MQQCNSEWSGCTVILAQDSSKAHLTYNLGKIWVTNDDEAKAAKDR